MSARKRNTEITPSNPPAVDVIANERPFCFRALSQAKHSPGIKASISDCQTQHVWMHHGIHMCALQIKGLSNA